MQADIGQGSNTLLAVIVAEVLGVSTRPGPRPAGRLGRQPDRPRFLLQPGDVHDGQRRALRRRAAAGVPARRRGRPALPTGRVARGGARTLSRSAASPAVGVPFMDALHKAMERSGALTASGAYSTSAVGGKFKGARAGTAPAYSFAAYVAEVDVDVDTGVYRAVKVWAAFDCGRALNRLAVEGQIEGSIHMGLGQVMGESMNYRGTRLMNPSLLEYKIPMPQQMPEVEILLVGDDDPERPVRGEGGRRGPADRDPSGRRERPPRRPGGAVHRPADHAGPGPEGDRPAPKGRPPVEGGVGRMHLDPFELHRTVDRRRGRPALARPRGAVRLPRRGDRPPAELQDAPQPPSAPGRARGCGGAAGPLSLPARGDGAPFRPRGATPRSEPTTPPSPPRSARWPLRSSARAAPSGGIS